MFTGIVEATARVLNINEGRSVVRLEIEKPASFQDVKIGDSISVNGICLTVETFDEKRLQFALAAETLQVTGWKPEDLQKATLNLERSLKFGDRIHGHLVSGHVDTMAEVTEVKPEGESLFVQIKIPTQLKSYFWPKGSITINGVSLTINKVSEQDPKLDSRVADPDTLIEVCLIPETLKQTNLAQLKQGEKVTVEIDTLARGMIHWLEQKGDKHVSP